MSDQEREREFHLAVNKLLDQLAAVCDGQPNNIVAMATRVRRIRAWCRLARPPRRTMHMRRVRARSYH